MKVDIFLSIRNKSARLPGKVLLRIKGKTVTEHLIDRLKTVKGISQIILCTSTNSKDDVLVEIAKNIGIEFFRGSEEDKLDRYLHAARKFHTDFMIIVDGDDIFCEPIFIDECIKKFAETNADYITVKNAPIGTVPFCIRTTALIKVCNLKNETSTEVFGSCFTDSGLFAVQYVHAQGKLCRPDIRLTLDYKEDHMLIKEIFENLYHGETLNLVDIVDFLNNNHKLLDINKHCQELFLRNQERFPKITLREDL